MKVLLTGHKGYIGAVAIPAVVFFVWIAFFRKQPLRRKHRRRRRISTPSAYLRATTSRAVSRPDDVPDGPKS